MKKLVVKKTLLVAVLLSLVFCTDPTDSFAAFPIKEQAKEQVQQTQASVQTMSTQQQSKLKKTINKPEKKNKDDEGVFGILALVFGILGWFPLAIIFGIIGTEPGREYRGLAQAGLFLGIIYGAIFLFYVGLLFYAL